MDNAMEMKTLRSMTSNKEHSIIFCCVVIKTTVKTEKLVLTFAKTASFSNRNSQDCRQLLKIHCVIFFEYSAPVVIAKIQKMWPLWKFRRCGHCEVFSQRNFFPRIRDFLFPHTVLLLQSNHVLIRDTILSRLIGNISKTQKNRSSHPSH
jgi:hypothetical protein